MFDKVEDNSELCTTKEFHDVMRKEGDHSTLPLYIRFEFLHCQRFFIRRAS